MRILLYTRHNATDWFRYIASNLKVASKTLIMSELRNEGDVSITDDFYRFYRQPDIAVQAFNKFGETECNEIIARCRLLRNLKKRKAMKMIGAAWQACLVLIDKFDPDMFLAFRIDSYVLDIIDRILKERGVPYIGLWRAAIVPNMVFITTRGEYTPLREPGEEEIQQCISRITSPDFQATSLKKNAKYDFLNFLKKYTYSNVRDCFLEIQRSIVRDPQGYRYLTTHHHVPEYRLGFSNRHLVNYMREDWSAVFEATPFEKRIFIGLQVNPEATIDYYVKNLALINYERVLFRIIDTLEKTGYRIFLKDHPNMFGRRSIEFIRTIAGKPSVVLVPYNVLSNLLVMESRATFTWTGTIGLQASMAGRCPIVVDPTYLMPGAFLQIQSPDDIATLPERIRAFRTPSDLATIRRETARHVLRAFIPGSMKWKEFKQNSPGAIQGADMLISSLNTYLPRFLHRG